MWARCFIEKRLPCGKKKDCLTDEITHCNSRKHPKYFGESEVLDSFRDSISDSVYFDVFSNFEMFHRFSQFSRFLS